MNDFLMNPGSFVLGCNYWALHAGIAMWEKWDATVVEEDFKKLSSYGIKIFRVFPTWPDFQPVSLLRQFHSRPYEYRFGEELLPDDPMGQAGVSREAMARFGILASLAEKHGICLVVGLITGWMSGRMFVPPALEGKNVLNDPEAIRWEVRFVQTFVSNFKDQKSIVAWDLGNECNCMTPIASPDEAWNWVSAITNAIRAVDTSRPVLSGMHALWPEGNWTLQDQGEIVDILTTHPYSSPTYGSDQDPADSLRVTLHATANTLFYRGIGKKPCFVEEMNSFGPSQTSNEANARYARTNLFSLWAHDCRGLLWWCAHDQAHLERAPYDWTGMEQSLGLLDNDNRPKPVLLEFEAFDEFLKELDEPLPPRIVDGVCILTEGQGEKSAWGIAYSAFVLAKQAGLDIEYSYIHQPIPDAPLYLLPSLQGFRSISRHRFSELLSKIKEGASLYISYDSAFINPFSEYAGFKIETRQKYNGYDTVTLETPDGPVVVELKGEYKLNLKQTTGTVLAVDQHGQPAFTRAKHGKGEVFFLNYPLEKYLFDRPGAFHDPGEPPYNSFYRAVAKAVTSGKAASCDTSPLCLTEHIRSDNSRTVVAVNHGPESRKTAITLSEGWRLLSAIHGNCRQAPCGVDLAIDGNDGAVFTIVREKII
ncbi:MAG: cellulase family glycosylhydrolase [Bacillota bacterium]|nr:cellulase family glycosylhydrolase [Bacillota bacterium]